MDKKEALLLVKRNGLELKNLPDEFQKDRDVVIEAIESNPTAIEYVHESLKKDMQAKLNWWYNLRDN